LLAVDAHCIQSRKGSAQNVQATHELLVVCGVLCVKVVGATSSEGFLVWM